MAENWYRVEIIAGPETYCYFGRTAMEELELMEALSAGKFVKLEELTYYDDQGEAHSWSEWDPNCIARIHLNPKFVVSIIPLSDHPRKRKTDGEPSALLKYPGASRNDDTE